MLNRSRASVQTSSLEHSGQCSKFLSECGWILHVATYTEYLLRSFHLLICFVFDSVKQVS